MYMKKAKQSSNGINVDKITVDTDGCEQGINRMADASIQNANAAHLKAMTHPDYSTFWHGEGPIARIMRELSNKIGNDYSTTNASMLGGRVGSFLGFAAIVGGIASQMPVSTNIKSSITGVLGVGGYKLTNEIFDIVEKLDVNPVLDMGKDRRLALYRAASQGKGRVVQAMLEKEDGSFDKIGSILAMVGAKKASKSLTDYGLLGEFDEITRTHSASELTRWCGYTLLELSKTEPNVAVSMLNEVDKKAEIQALYPAFTRTMEGRRTEPYTSSQYKKIINCLRLIKKSNLSLQEHIAASLELPSNVKPLDNENFGQTRKTSHGSPNRNDRSPASLAKYDLDQFKAVKLPLDWENLYRRAKEVENQLDDDTVVQSLRDKVETSTKAAIDI